MTTRATASRRYAGALFQLAREAKAIDVVAEDLEAIQGLISTSRDFQRFLDGGQGDTASRHAALHALFDGNAHPLTVKFLLLLEQKRRFKLLPMLFVAFQELMDQARGIQRIDIKTAQPLDEDQRQRIEQLFGEKLQRTVVSTTGTDARLIAGFVVKAGDLVFDATVTSQLNRLHRDLVTAF